MSNLTRRGILAGVAATPLAAALTFTIGAAAGAAIFQTLTL